MGLRLDKTQKYEMLVTNVAHKKTIPQGTIWRVDLVDDEGARYNCEYRSPGPLQTDFIVSHRAKFQVGYAADFVDEIMPLSPGIATPPQPHSIPQATPLPSLIKKERPQSESMDVSMFALSKATDIMCARIHAQGLEGSALDLSQLVSDAYLIQEALLEMKGTLPHI